ncbi:hypothetical protein E8E11_009113 [Didymella keratinophila]|nr:hypothetical protein E8E11_009113 [Didymella keratinophila]
MDSHRPRVKRTDGSSSHLINDLINAANTNDRFKLLEDDEILPGNLTNPIHPLFHQLKHDERLQQALRLASQFLLHDRLLEFFASLLYGRVMHDLESRNRYLCDPLIRASKAKQALMLAKVRQALECLATRVKIIFVSQQQRTWARTIIDDSASTSDLCCCRTFQTERSPKIELTKKFTLFYHAKDGYAKATRSAQFRHDFLFATTLVHEVAHAVGVMRRGDLSEPHYRLDFPDTEWGYAWENFMFGCIINPQDKSVVGTHILMCKIWADVKTANRNGGKEYSDVSMSWIAQWFRTETWDIVEKAGPTAIMPPTAHFKIQISHQQGAWIIWSDNLDVREDIAALYSRWQTRLETQDCSADGGQVSHLVYFNELTATDLQVPNVPVPQRVRDAPKASLLQKLLASKRQSTEKPARGMRRKRATGENDDLLPLTKEHVETPPSPTSGFTPINAPLIAACRASSPCGTQRKRRTNNDEDEYLPPNRKRLRAGAKW